MLPEVADYVLDDPLPLLDAGISVGPIRFPTPFKDLLLLLLRQVGHLLYDLTRVWVVQLDPLQTEACASRCTESLERGRDEEPSVDSRR